jgi:hypothetical protein
MTRKQYDNLIILFSLLVAKKTLQERPMFYPPHVMEYLHKRIDRLVTRYKNPGAE